MASSSFVGSAEIKILKENSNEDIAELFERAQLVLLLTPPLSSSDASSDSEVTSLPMDMQATKPVSRWGPRMHEKELSPMEHSLGAAPSFYRNRANSEDVIVIRKGTLSPQNMPLLIYLHRSSAFLFPPNYSSITSLIIMSNLTILILNFCLEKPFFRVSRGTSMAIKTFLPEFFSKDDSIDMAECSSEVYTKMKDFWDFFDTDVDGIVSRSDVEKGESFVPCIYLIIAFYI